MDDYTIPEAVIVESSRLRGELQAHPAVHVTYCVCEKRPPRYDRRWYLRVMWSDGLSETFTAPDAIEGPNPAYRSALSKARRIVEGSK